MTEDVINEILQAETRIRPYIWETSLKHSIRLSELTGCNLYFKLENLQHTGSFKVRGALNKLLSLSPEQRDKGVVAASTGNHGAAVAFGLNRLRANGLIFVPENASPSKLEIIQGLGTEIRTYGLDGAETESHARNYADEHGMVYISPYNDLEVIGGQGTIGLELARQLKPIEAVFVSLGGGGMISGIATHLKSLSKETRIVGCSPENSPVMVESVKAGKILDMASKPTLSDGTAGGIEPGAITFDLCRALVDDYVLVSEDDIKEAMRLFMRTHHMMIEGAAGAALASFLKVKEQYQGQNVVVVICGANISLDTLKSIL